MRPLAGAFLTIGLTSCVVPETVEQFASSSAELAEQAKREDRRLGKAGFEPLATLSAKGVEVLRVDPMWDLLDYPSVELARDRTGTITIFLRFRGHKRSQQVSPETWVRIANLAPQAFAPVDAKRLSQARRKIGYCHVWHELETNMAGQPMRETVSPCLGQLQKTGVDFAETLARVAIDNIDLCEAERSELSIERALAKCGSKFGPTTENFRLIENSN